jgi:IS5 family transposase
MKQTSFAQTEFAAKKKTTRRERFLAEMEQTVPWSKLLKALDSHLVTTGKVRVKPVS